MTDVQRLPLVVSSCELACEVVMAGPDDDRSLGLALSGGGHRAALWALGAMMCVSDNGRAKNVEHVSSVSGGSITNGMVGLAVRYDEADGDELVEKVARRLAPVLAKESTLFDHPLSKLAVLGFGASGLGALAGSVGLAAAGLGAPVPGAVCAGIAAGSGALAWALFRQRGALCRMTLDKLLYEGAPLEKLSDGKVEHVMCATDLQFDEHVYMSGRFVYAWRLGVGSPKSLSLADAVQASASFPFGFPARVISTRELGFQFHALVPGERQTVPEVLSLIDGGVYDNMADQWLVGLDRRLAPDAPQRDEDPANAKRRADLLSTRLAHPRTPAEVLIVNASPAYPRSDFRGSLFGVREEIDTAVRVFLSMHDNATSLRRQSLFDRFRASDGRRRPRRGALVHIATSPLDAIADVRGNAKSTAEERARADAAEAFVQITTSLGAGETLEEHWRAVADANGEVGTVLWAVGVEPAARLMHHAYVLAAVQSHVWLGHALPDVRRVSLARFSALADGRSPGGVSRA